MILHSAPQDEAATGNVTDVGEFRIRNSAKAFSILSSGLYANKFRAIVRELSCNAVDSHVAAGKADVPFDVHLPTQLEPWFSVRDYGTGLSHDQVTNVYTTYFESTKTESDEFIGALGLGSKSPFSYTNNFTVTAIKDGVRGIYSAFINHVGVPSVVLMSTDYDCGEPNGVEVKFAVDNYNDFNTFKSESRHVFTYFKHRPVIHGPTFTFIDPNYTDKDIVKGIHSIKDATSSLAIMGNIAYPIAIPRSDNTIGDLRQLLDCGLVIEFAIGELDFQASREGLSYIPMTVDNIKAKLEQLNDALSKVLAKEADKFTNLWDRLEYLNDKRYSRLWSNAVEKYAADTKFPLCSPDRHYGNKVQTKLFHFPVDELAAKYNIVLSSVDSSGNNSGFSRLKPSTFYTTDPTTKKEVVSHEWRFSPSSTLMFVENDTKVGAIERAKHNFRAGGRIKLMLLDKADKKLPMLTDQFYAAMFNPPASQIQLVSSLDVKPRRDSGLGKNVTILKLQRKDAISSFHYRRGDGHDR